MRSVLPVLLLLVVTPLSGCIEPLEPITADADGGCAILEPGRASDGVLRLLTYDIAAFSDEMLDEFTNQTGG